MTHDSKQTTIERRTPNAADSKLKILICYHKPYTIPNNDEKIFLPIQVGKSLTDEDLHMQGDNEVNGLPCDNISDKNASYCELTAMYWAWKNLRKIYPDVQYVGLYHYRRFFAFDEKKFFPLFIQKPETEIKNYRINAEKVINIFQIGNGNNVIVPKIISFPYSVKAQYCLHFVSKDYGILREVIKKDFPEYYEDFINIMENNNKLRAYNMFIMKYDDFVSYCEWIFAVLSIMENAICMEHYSTYQKRCLAVMSERLFDVWLKKNKKALKPFNVFFYDKNFLNTDNSDGKIKRVFKSFYLCFLDAVAYFEKEAAVFFSKYPISCAILAIRKIFKFSSKNKS